MSRRLWLKASSVMLGFAFTGSINFETLADEEKETTTIGVITDAHYADREAVGSRYYRDSIAKVREAVETFNDRKPSFCIELGDLVDKGESLELEISYLKTIEAEYTKFKGERHYVLGNHDTATFSKKQFLDNCGARKKYYSFDNGKFHFVILDACYNKDESDYNAGNFQWTEAYIPAKEQEWLKADLSDTSKKTIIFVHQRLDDDQNPHCVKNALIVRQILEESEKVMAVFQGHEHRGAYSQINGIHYCTLQALVEGSGLENNAYSLIHIHEDGLIKIDGLGKQTGAVRE